MARAPKPDPAAVRRARLAAGLTQGEAARLVYTTTRTWQQWECGDRGMHAAVWELFRMKTERMIRAQGARADASAAIKR